MIFKRCVYELLQTYTILMIPLLNPDGYMISLYGHYAVNNSTLQNKIKKMNPNYAEWKYNSRGIDINRNFPSRLWKPKKQGDYAASENETKALIQVFHHYRIRCFGFSLPLENRFIIIEAACLKDTTGNNYILPNILRILQVMN